MTQLLQNISVSMFSSRGPIPIALTNLGNSQATPVTVRRSALISCAPYVGVIHKVALYLKSSKVLEKSKDNLSVCSYKKPFV